MREILFRGKRLDNGEWYYGSYLFLHVPNYDWAGMRRGPAKDVHFIIDEKDINYAVDHVTLGQYTGLTDKNGKKIFEGDIVIDSFGRDTGNKADIIAKVIYNNGCFGIVVLNYNDKDFYPSIYSTGFIPEVVGNIYDNPELLFSSVE